MKRSFIIAALASVGLTGCSGFLDPPRTIGDVNAGYRYVAIDPLPINFTNDFSKCSSIGGATPGLIDALHDLTARVSTQQISGEGSLSAPVIKAGASGSTYQVTQDFIAYDQTPLRFEVPAHLADSRYSAADVASGPQLRLLREEESARGSNRVLTIPVYVGLGLRLTANVTVRKGNVNLADLGALSAAAKAEQIRGSLVAQTLGMSGPKVASLLPLPGELNPTTIQNATVAIGSIKALLDDPSTRRWPRVVGIHYPFERVSPAMTNAIVSALAAKRIEWKPCSTEEARLKVL